MNKKTAFAIAAAALLAVAAAAAPAAAQTAAEGFALDRFNPASPGSDWFALDSLDLRGHVRPAFRVGLDWAHKPLVLYDADGNEVTTLVQRQVLVHTGLALNLAGRLRIGIDLPIVVNQLAEAARVNGFDFPAVDGVVVGDLAAALDLRLFGTYGGPITVAVGAEVFFPTGKQEKYSGDGQVRVLPRVQAAGEVGAFAYAAMFGFQTRRSIADGQFREVGVGNEVTAGLAFGLKPIPSVLVGPEIYGSSVVVDGNFLVTRATPLEAVLSARFIVAKDWRVGLGAGPGITRGLGSPQVRVLARAEYLQGMPPSDRDRDRIPDVDDACPDEPGIRTGDPKTNGCPPPADRDRDGIIDAEDACPLEYGVRTDDPKTNGCPLPQDRDKDGVLDRDDACPDVPGDKTDDPKTNGCPPPDRDKDGVLDRDDACPDKPGAKTDNPKTNGCPDTDMDGILDPEDACPDQAGPRDPDPKKNGCPVARVEKGQIRILEQVKFKTGSAVILPESDTILEAVAAILRDHPEIKKIRVEGHTDNRGGRAYNLGLSRRRAASVVKWLVNMGNVDKSRMTSEGYGFERPIASNSTEDGRRENRRVEFHIVEPPPTE